MTICKRWIDSCAYRMYWVHVQVPKVVMVPYCPMCYFVQRMYWLSPLVLNEETIDVKAMRKRWKIFYVNFSLLLKLILKRFFLIIYRTKFFISPPVMVGFSKHLPNFRFQNRQSWNSWNPKKATSNSSSDGMVLRMRILYRSRKTKNVEMNNGG